MLKTEYEYYKKHLAEFLIDHRGEFVVIQGENVRGFFKTEKEGIESMKGQELGTYFVKQCLPFDETTVEYRSRVVFT